MVDQLDSNSRSPNPDAEVDDPLAELARIIGYERPVEPVKKPVEEPDSSDLDLEAELMRELDVPQLAEPRERDLPVERPSDNAPVARQAAPIARQEMVQAEEPVSQADVEDPWGDDVVDLGPDWDYSEAPEPETGDVDASEPEMASDTDAEEAVPVASSPVMTEPVEADDMAVADEPVEPSSYPEDDEDDSLDWDLSEALAAEALAVEALAADSRADVISSAEPDAGEGDPEAVSVADFDAGEVQLDLDADDEPGVTSADTARSDDDQADDMINDLEIPDFDSRLEEAMSQATGKPVPVDQVLNKSGQVIAADFGAGRPVVLPDDSGDSVLADMDRFQVAPADPKITHLRVEPASEQGDPADAKVFDEVSPFESGFGGDLEGSEADLIDQAPEADAAPADETAPADEALDAEMDFESYLSTELDVFEHEVAMDNDDEHAPAVGAEVEAAAPTEPDAEAETESVTTQEAQVVESEAEHLSVFDDAAEELLADIAYDDTVRAADTVETDGADDWLSDSIEDGVAEAMDEELEDLSGSSASMDAPANDGFDDADEFELDIEQVLADTVVEDEQAAPEPVAVTPVAVADDAADATDMVDWQFDDEPADPQVDTGETGFSFTDPDADADTQSTSSESDGDDRSGLAAAAVAAAFVAPRTVGVTPQEDMDTGTDMSEPAVQADEDGYYFDADLISQPEDTLEAVNEIDVPELFHDEPQTIDPDYDSEIERDFADIVDRHEPESEAVAAPSATGAFGSAEGWNRGASAARGYEHSPDYIELERELGVDNVHAQFEEVSNVHHDEALSGLENLQDDLMYVDSERERTESSRGPVLALVVLGVALVAGAGALGWSMWSNDETTADGGPRIIRADTDPVKVLPENPGGVTVPNQDKAVYDRVAGGDGASTGQPTLINSAEEPVDVVQRTLDPEILPLEGRGDVPLKSEDRLLADGAMAESDANVAAPAVVSPRKVRTMIVKPDGSIVAREDPDPVAETAQPVTETPQTAEAAPTGAAEPLAAPDQTAAETAEPKVPTMQLSQPDDVVAEAPVMEQASTEASADANGTATADDNTSIAPVRVVTTQQILPVSNAPIPQGRPADQPVNVVGTVTQGGAVAAAPQTPAATAPAQAQPVEVAAAPAAAAPVANPGGYYMQIASQPSAEGAQASWNTLSSRYNSVLGGLPVDIQRADIPGKGVFHRVRVPAGSRDQANALCSRYKAAGGSCFVSR
ncbi:SPOR domain-containing protein [Hoeflea ulvae]|uniref:SPOR domain-containing protein n=1 Tax=Hoeflea ulvae TaxID=2983764 RepID=A0ABT3YHD0_9HYPH|nr:SPOR domain-containing protein [Hoeflea ulvae]MCY0095223.1 SPOR domain-containing protein [Hoeflea ulvae]